MSEIVAEGMEAFNVGRVDYSRHITVPAVDAVAVCFEAYRVQVALRDGVERYLVFSCFSAEFRSLGKQVVAELKMTGKKRLQGVVEDGCTRELRLACCTGGLFRSLARLRFRCEAVGRVGISVGTTLLIPPFYGRTHEEVVVHGIPSLMFFNGKYTT